MDQTISSIKHTKTRRAFKDVLNDVVRTASGDTHTLYMADPWKFATDLRRMLGERADGEQSARMIVDVGAGSLQRAVACAFTMPFAAYYVLVDKGSSTETLALLQRCSDQAKSLQDNACDKQKFFAANSQLIHKVHVVETQYADVDPAAEGARIVQEAVQQITDKHERTDQEQWVLVWGNMGNAHAYCHEVQSMYETTRDDTDMAQTISKQNRPLSKLIKPSFGDNSIVPPDVSKECVEAVHSVQQKQRHSVLYTRCSDWTSDHGMQRLQYLVLIQPVAELQEGQLTILYNRQLMFGSSVFECFATMKPISWVHQERVCFSARPTVYYRDLKKHSESDSQFVQSLSEFSSDLSERSSTYNVDTHRGLTAKRYAQLVIPSVYKHGPANQVLDSSVDLDCSVDTLTGTFSHEYYAAICHFLQSFTSVSDRASALPWINDTSCWSQFAVANQFVALPVGFRGTAVSVGTERGLALAANVIANCLAVPNTFNAISTPALTAALASYVNFNPYLAVLWDYMLAHINDPQLQPQDMPGAPVVAVDLQYARRIFHDLVKIYTDLLVRSVQRGPNQRRSLMLKEFKDTRCVFFNNSCFPRYMTRMFSLPFLVAVKSLVRDQQAVFVAFAVDPYIEGDSVVDVVGRRAAPESDLVHEDLRLWEPVVVSETIAAQEAFLLKPVTWVDDSVSVGFGFYGLHVPHASDPESFESEALLKRYISTKPSVGRKRGCAVTLDAAGFTSSSSSVPLMRPLDITTSESQSRRSTAVPPALFEHVRALIAMRKDKFALLCHRMNLSDSKRKELLVQSEVEAAESMEVVDRLQNNQYIDAPSVPVVSDITKATEHRLRNEAHQLAHAVDRGQAVGGAVDVGVRTMVSALSTRFYSGLLARTNRMYDALRKHKYPADARTIIDSPEYKELLDRLRVVQLNLASVVADCERSRSRLENCTMEDFVVGWCSPLMKALYDVIQAEMDSAEAASRTDGNADAVRETSERLIIRSKDFSKLMRGTEQRNLDDARKLALKLESMAQFVNGSVFDALHNLNTFIGRHVSVFEPLSDDVLSMERFRALINTELDFTSLLAQADENARLFISVRTLFIRGIVCSYEQLSRARMNNAVSVANMMDLKDAPAVIRAMARIRMSEFVQTESAAIVSRALADAQPSVAPAVAMDSAVLVPIQWPELSKLTATLEELSPIQVRAALEQFGSAIRMRDPARAGTHQRALVCDPASGPIVIQELVGSTELPATGSDHGAVANVFQPAGLLSSIQEFDSATMDEDMMDLEFPSSFFEYLGRLLMDGTLDSDGSVAIEFPAGMKKLERWAEKPYTFDRKGRSPIAITLDHIERGRKLSCVSMTEMVRAESRRDREDRRRARHPRNQPDASVSKDQESDDTSAREKEIDRANQKYMRVASVGSVYPLLSNFLSEYQLRFGETKLHELLEEDHTYTESESESESEQESGAADGSEEDDDDERGDIDAYHLAQMQPHVRKGYLYKTMVMLTRYAFLNTFGRDIQLWRDLVNKLPRWWHDQLSFLMHPGSVDDNVTGLLEVLAAIKDSPVGSEIKLYSAEDVVRAQETVRSRLRDSSEHWSNNSIRYFMREECYRINRDCIVSTLSMRMMLCSAMLINTLLHSSFDVPDELPPTDREYDLGVRFAQTSSLLREYVARVRSNATGQTDRAVKVILSTVDTYRAVLPTYSVSELLLVVEDILGRYVPDAMTYMAYQAVDVVINGLPEYEAGRGPESDSEAYAWCYLASAMNIIYWCLKHDIGMFYYRERANIDESQVFCMSILQSFEKHIISTALSYTFSELMWMWSDSSPRDLRRSCSPFFGFRLSKRHSKGVEHVIRNQTVEEEFDAAPATILEMAFIAPEHLKDAHIINRNMSHIPDVLERFPNLTISESTYNAVVAKKQGLTPEAVTGDIQYEVDQLRRDMGESTPVLGAPTSVSISSEPETRTPISRVTFTPMRPSPATTLAPSTFGSISSTSSVTPPASRVVTVLTPRRKRQRSPTSPTTQEPSKMIMTPENAVSDPYASSVLKSPPTPTLPTVSTPPPVLARQLDVPRLGPTAMSDVAFLAAATHAGQSPPQVLNTIRLSLEGDILAVDRSMGRISELEELMGLTDVLVPDMDAATDPRRLSDIISERSHALLEFYTDSALARRASLARELRRTSPPASPYVAPRD